MGARPLVAWLVVAIFLQTVLLECSLLLFPFLPLLLVPSCHARNLFSRIAEFGQASWLGLAVSCLRFVLGVPIYLRTRGQLPSLAGRDVLVASNHPTRIDWLFLWALPISLGRLPGLKIVLKEVLRKAPGFGWAMQCATYAFLTRGNRETDLATVDKVCFLGSQHPLLLLLFPEGTDLSDENLARSHKHSEEKGLPKYHQVLHPRTAGFAAALKSLAEAARSSGMAPPVLLDVTMAYEDFVPGELPNEKKVFGQGRICKAVYIVVEAVEYLTSESESVPKEAEAAQLCVDLWAKKEERLSRFYAPCQLEGRRSGGGVPDQSALSFQVSRIWEDCPGAKGRIFASFMVALGCELVAGYLFYVLPIYVVLLFFGTACGSFLMIQRLCGGIDLVILRHAQKYPDTSRKRA
ncbi:unnamed protein product [Effrenium voratum]|nr:unnamed protein product [Effrenium voratum]